MSTGSYGAVQRPHGSSPQWPASSTPRFIMSTACWPRCCSVCGFRGGPARLKPLSEKRVENISSADGLHAARPCTLLNAASAVAQPGDAPLEDFLLVAARKVGHRHLGEGRVLP